MIVTAMLVFLLFRCLMTLLRQAAMLSQADNDKDQKTAIWAMIITGIAAVCTVYLAIH